MPSRSNDNDSPLLSHENKECLACGAFAAVFITVMTVSTMGFVQAAGIVGKRAAFDVEADTGVPCRTAERSDVTNETCNGTFFVATTLWGDMRMECRSVGVKGNATNSSVGLGEDGCVYEQLERSDGAWGKTDVLYNACTVDVASPVMQDTILEEAPDLPLAAYTALCALGWHNGTDAMNALNLRTFATAPNGSRAVGGTPLLLNQTFLDRIIVVRRLGLATSLFYGFWALPVWLVLAVILLLVIGVLTGGAAGASNCDCGGGKCTRKEKECCMMALATWVLSMILMTVVLTLATQMYSGDTRPISAVQDWPETEAEDPGFPFQWRFEEPWGIFAVRNRRNPSLARGLMVAFAICVIGPPLAVVLYNVLKKNEAKILAWLPWRRTERAAAAGSDAVGGASPGYGGGASPGYGGGASPGYRGAMSPPDETDSEMSREQTDNMRIESWGPEADAETPASYE